ncbi:MAG: helix-turn-helix transcriptional regulator [Candidatus Nanopelagicales bacterium]
MGASGRDAARDGQVGVDGSVLAFLRVLAADPDGGTVATALARGILAEWNPEQVSVYVLDRSGEHLVEVASFGTITADRTDYSRVPLTVPTPFTQVLRTGEEGVWSLTDGAAAFPSVAGWVAIQPSAETGECLVLPLWSAGRTVGVLSVLFSTPVEKSWRLRSALDSATAALAVWSLGSARTTADSRTTGRGVAPTERQRKVLDQLAAGRTNAQIAEDLKVSVGTVKTDLAHLFRLYGVRDRQSLVDVAGTALAAVDGHG